MAFIFATLWRAGVLTDAKLAEIRYSGRGTLLLRTFKVIYYGTIFNCVVLAWVLAAAVGLTELFLPWHRWLPAAVYDPPRRFRPALRPGTETSSSAPAYPQYLTATNNIISLALILLFTALYSMTGGLRGVVATDIVQFAAALAGTLLFTWFIAQAAGGFAPWCRVWSTSTGKSGQPGSPPSPRASPARGRVARTGPPCSYPLPPRAGRWRLRRWSWAWRWCPCGGAAPTSARFRSVPAWAP
jgi:hypothetical protein